MTSTKPPRPRVMITGLGLVSPLGIGIEPFESNLAAGRGGIAEAGLEASAAPGRVAAQVRDFSSDITKRLMPKKQRKFIRVMCREIELGVVAALSAIETSELDLDAIDHERLGVDFGANLMFSPPEVLKEACWSVTESNAGEREFEYDRWGDEGMKLLEPLWLLKYLPNMPACHIGIALDAQGPNNSLTLDDASGNLVIGEATRIIQRSRADIMIAGTTGTKVHPVKTIHSALWRDLAHGDGPPETWCRPFDAASTGQVVGEGAAALVLETAEHAASRGAVVYGEILGMGSSCVTDQQGHTEYQAALGHAMRAALRDADLQPEEIGHVNAHGLAIRSVDRAEAAAIAELFPQGVPVTAFKSYVGNAGAGSGIQELTASLLGLRQGWIPKTLNCDEIDPDCPIDVVRGQHRPTENKRFMNVNVTRTGQASAVVVRGL